MKNYHSLLLLLICSCSLLKRTSVSKEQNSQHLSEDSTVYTTVDETRRNTGQQILYANDSSDDEYAIRFWPKGVVNISPGGQFAGEFDSIQVKGRKKSVAASAGIFQTQQLDTKNVITDFRHEKDLNSASSAETKSQIPDAKTIAIVMAVVAVVVFAIKIWRFDIKN